jgi:hypothetical protein
MATFLAAAYEHVSGEPLPVGTHGFQDVQGNVHEEAISKVAAAGKAGAAKKSRRKRG